MDVPMGAPTVPMMASGGPLSPEKVPPAPLTALRLCIWIVKDVSWMLLIREGLGVALLSVVLETFALFTELTKSRYFSSRSTEALIEWLWLVGNATWMSSELLFGERAYWALEKWTGPIPALHGPVKVDPSLYGQGARLALCIHSLGLLVFVGFIVCLVRRSLCPSHEARAISDQSGPRRFGMPSADYARLFIGAWIVKDMCWNLTLPLSMIAAAVMVELLCLDCFWQFGGFANLIEVVWLNANLIWALCELWNLQTAWLRPLALSIFFTALALAGADLLCRIYGSETRCGGVGAGNGDSTVSPPPPGQSCGLDLPTAYSATTPSSV